MLCTQTGVRSAGLHPHTPVLRVLSPQAVTQGQNWTLNRNKAYSLQCGICARQFLHQGGNSAQRYLIWSEGQTGMNSYFQNIGKTSPATKTRNHVQTKIFVKQKDILLFQQVKCPSINDNFYINHFTGSC